MTSSPLPSSPWPDCQIVGGICVKLFEGKRSPQAIDQLVSFSFLLQHYRLPLKLLIKYQQLQLQKKTCYEHLNYWYLKVQPLFRLTSSSCKGLWQSFFFPFRAKKKAFLLFVFLILDLCWVFSSNLSNFLVVILVTFFFLIKKIQNKSSKMWKNFFYKFLKT